MTPPRNIIGSLSQSRLLRRPWWRRGLFAALILICAIFTFFPERYRAAVTVTPTDPSSLGLGSALGQLSAVNTVFGSQAAVEISLKIGRSVYARNVVIDRLKLMQRLHFNDREEASRWLADAVDIRSLRGGIVQVDSVQRDPAFARELVSAVTIVTRERLAEIARRQTAYKRDVLVKLVADAGGRLDRAQNAYDTFRRTTRFANPGVAIDSIGGRIPVLQAAIRQKDVELNAARQFATDDNIQVRQIQAEIAALRNQLAQFQALSGTSANSLGRVVEQSTRSERLERELYEANSLYFAYRNYLAGTAVEDLTSTANIRILEAPYVDTERQWNLVPMVLGILIGLLAFSIEFYQLRPPVGDRR